jgi:hypothetical protein
MHSRIRGKSDRPHGWSTPPASPWSDEATTAAWSPQDLNDVVRHAGAEASLPPSAAEVEARAIEHAGADWLDVSNSWIETTAILDESSLLEDTELTLTTQPYLAPISAQLATAPLDADAIRSQRSSAASSGVTEAALLQPSAARPAPGRPLLTLGTTARPHLRAAGRQLALNGGPDADERSHEQRARSEPRSLQPSATDTLRSIPPLPQALRAGGPTFPRPVSALPQPSAARAFEPMPPTAAKTFGLTTAPELGAASIEQRPTGHTAPQAPSARTGAHPPIASTPAHRTGAHPPIASTPAHRTGAHPPISELRWIEPSSSRSVPLVRHAAPLELDDNPFAKPPLWRRTWVQGAALLAAVCGSSWFGYHLLTAERSPVLLSLHATAIPATTPPVPPETTTSAASDPAPQPTAAGALDATAARVSAPSRRRWMHRPRAAAQPNHAASSSPSADKTAQNAQLAELLPTEPSDSQQADPSSAAPTASDSAASAREQASANAVDLEHGKPKPNQADGFKTGSAAPPSDPNLGTLRLNSRPWADIFIDGRPYGHTPQQAIGLSSGQHLVKLSNREFGLTKIFLLEMAGGATVTRIVNMDEDQ